MDKHADSDLEKTVGEGDAGLGWLRPQESKSASALGESWTVTLLLVTDETREALLDKQASDSMRLLGKDPK